MKTFFLFPAFLFYCCYSSAQTKLDTVSTYICNTRVVTSDGVTTFSVNGASVSKEEYNRVMKKVEEKKTCNPCYLKQYTPDDKIHSGGLFYYICPGAKKEEQEEKTGINSKHIIIKSKSCQEGEWKFYDKDGKVEYVEFYNRGEKINDPKQ